MAEGRKYKVKSPQVTLQMAADSDKLAQQRLDEVFDYIFSKIELEQLASLSYNDNKIGDQND